MTEWTDPDAAQERWATNRCDWCGFPAYELHTVVWDIPATKHTPARPGQVRHVCGRCQEAGPVYDNDQSIVALGYADAEFTTTGMPAIWTVYDCEPAKFDKGSSRDVGQILGYKQPDGSTEYEARIGDVLVGTFSHRKDAQTAVVLAARALVPIERRTGSVPSAETRQGMREADAILAKAPRFDSFEGMTQALDASDAEA